MEKLSASGWSNVNGSGDRKPGSDCDTWREYWEKHCKSEFEKRYSNPDNIVKCAIEGCNNHVGKMEGGKLTLYTKDDHANYSVGGHLWQLEDGKKEWIGIICNSCNAKSCPACKKDTKDEDCKDCKDYEEFSLETGTILVRANKKEISLACI